MAPRRNRHHKLLPRPAVAAPRSRARCRGSAIAYFVVILGLICASLITTMSLASIQTAQVASLGTRRDAAFYAAEGGLQRALWELDHNNWASRGYPALAGSLGDATYTATSHTAGTNIIVTATGFAGSSPTASISVTATLSPKATIPAVSVGGNITANHGNGGGRLDIYGNIHFFGQSLNRNVPNFNIHEDDAGHGDFYYINDTVNNNHQLDGLSFDPGHTYHKDTSLPAKPDVSQMANTLRADGCTTLGNRPSYIDLSTAINNVVYIPSDLQIDRNTVINGNGIIIVQNSCQVSDGNVFEDHHVTIVCLQDIRFDPGNHTTFSDNTAIGLYAKTQVGIQSTCEISGVVSAGQDFSTSGKIVVKFDPSVIPLADPRLSGGGSGYAVTSFTGPLQ